MKCERCGATLAGDRTAVAPGEPIPAACPRCLLGIGLASDPEELSAEAGGPLEATEAVGDRIGPYRILGCLGEGGMGVVYLAEQSEPIRRRVALKLIKLGMDTRDVIARFETERQVLALMNHPHIARVYDAGVAPDGRPYFVMDPVPGEAITEFCDRRELTLRQRIDLFLQACDAIQHAHEKGIIHRDIKPSNVLVSEPDGRARVTVIDFGIAKAIQPHLTERTLLTRQGLFLGTPEYMSPEQAASEGRDVDTRTDVYALGMLLYELLVGRLPLDFRQDRDRGMDEIRRLIRTEEFPKPSTRLSAIGRPSEGAAQRRRLDPSSLRKALRGDLDWIVMKALEKDRPRRYGSPRELAADLERYLRHEPVSAGPPGAVYRMKKLARRHRVAVSFASAILVLLVGFAVAMGVQASRIARERDRANREAEAARQVARFLTGLFEVSDPGEARGNSISAREILDRGAEKIDRELAGQPEVQARLMALMGSVYRKLGLYKQAEPLLERSQRVLGTVLGEDHPETVRSMLEMGELLFSKGKFVEAEELLRRALDHSRRGLGESDALTLACLADLAVIAQFQGRLDEAEKLFAEALERRRQALGPEHRDTLETLSNIAGLSLTRGKLAEAEAYGREAYEGRRRALGADHPETLDSLTNLGTILLFLKKYEEAEPLLREAVDLGSRLRPDHHYTLIAINNLGRTLAEQGRLEEADVYLRRALEAFRNALGEVHPETLTAMGNLGDLCTSRGRLEEGRSLLATASGKARSALPEKDVMTAIIVRKYGRVLIALKQYDEAEKELVEAERNLTAALGPDHPYTRKAVENLAELYEARGEADKAALWRARLQKGGASSG